MRHLLLALVGFSLLASAAVPPASNAAARVWPSLRNSFGGVDPVAKRRELVKYLSGRKSSVPPFGHSAKPKPKPPSVFKAQAKALCLDKRVLPSLDEMLEPAYLHTNWNLVHHKGASTFFRGNVFLDSNSFLGFNGAEYADLTFVPYERFNSKHPRESLGSALDHGLVKKLSHVKQFRRIELYGLFLVIVQEPSSICSPMALTTAPGGTALLVPEAKAKVIVKGALQGLKEAFDSGVVRTITQVDALASVVDAKGQVSVKLDALCDNASCPRPGSMFKLPQEEEAAVFYAGLALHSMLSAGAPSLSGHKVGDSWTPDTPLKVFYNSTHFDKVSKEGMRTLKGMLASDEKKRWTIKQALSSKWFQ